MRIFVGLDCGGTASRVLAVDEDGEAVFRGQSGGANLLATPDEAIARNLGRVTEGCPPATAVCGAFAGLVGPTERARALRFLGELFPGASLRAEPDYAAAHAAAPSGTDVTVVAGTGSLVCGPDAQGRLVKTGVGGYLLGDEGSGYRLGRAALVHYLRHPRNRSEALQASVAELFPAATDAEIVAALHRAPAPQTLLARLLPAFASDLEAGADYARSTADREEAELAEIVALHARTHLPDRPRVGVALAGGVWKAASGFERRFEAAVRERLPNVAIDVERILRPPVQGAVALAKEHLIGNGE